MHNNFSALLMWKDKFCSNQSRSSIRGRRMQTQWLRDCYFGSHPVSYSVNTGVSFLRHKASRLKKYRALLLPHNSSWHSAQRQQDVHPYVRIYFSSVYGLDACCRWSWWPSTPDTCRSCNLQTKEDLHRSSISAPLMYIHHTKD